MDQDKMIETMKSSFLFNFRTANVMVDTFLTGLIIMFSTYLFNFAQKIIAGDFDFFSFFRKFKEFKQKATIVVSGKKLQGAHDTRLEYSTNFFAILHQIKKLDCISADIHELSEIPIQDPSDVSYDYEDRSDDGENEKVQSKGFGTNLIVSQSAPFKINNEIECYVNINKEKDDNEKNPTKTEEFQIKLKSEVLNADQLRDVLASWVKEYEGLLNKTNDKYLKYFIYTPKNDFDDDYYDATRYFEEFKFESGKSFQNIFYPEKEEIVQRLDFFENNKDWYKKRGIPYTIGFMFYGDPGCGKTSTIKAIANYTQRHIISIPLNKIRTVKELLNLFYNVKMNYQDIPLDKRLYILEDIDAADMKEVVGERSKQDTDDKKSTDNNAEKEDEGGFDMNLLNLIKPSGPMMKWQSNKLTLANLLEVLDGVMEMDGRMLIITTNYPEKLDKALIRPGRVDMKVKFGKCTRQCIVQMYEHYFEEEIPSSFDISQFPDLKWTPAEVTQVFLNNMHNPAASLTELINSESLMNVHILPATKDTNQEIEEHTKDCQKESSDIVNRKENSKTESSESSSDSSRSNSPSL